MCRIRQNLLPGPAHDIGPHVQYVALDVLGERQIAEQTQLLEFLFPCPATDGTLISRLATYIVPYVPDTTTRLDILDRHSCEACLLHPLLLRIVFHYGEGASEFLAALVENFRPLVHRRPLDHGAIIAGHDDTCLEVFEVATGLTAFIRLLVERGPVGDGAKQVSHVYEIEAVRLEGPFQSGIVYLEAQVRREPRGLDGRDVCPDHLGARVLVREVSGGKSVTRRRRYGERREIYIAQIPAAGPVLAISPKSA